jgi:hypothetical protein
MITHRALQLVAPLIPLVACHRAPVQYLDAQVDVAPEIPDISHDTCQPGCHWDCMTGGGVTCIDNTLYQMQAGAAPCCRTTDPWPGGGPPCTSARYVCATTCQKVDSRYSHCFAQRPSAEMPRELLNHVLRLGCAEATYASVGDVCDGDEQCRPMAASVFSRLACDVVSQKCVVAARPVPPLTFGGDCGLKAAEMSGRFTDSVVLGKFCPLCHIAKDPACLRQGCTISCEFDEDCPMGTVCICTLGYGAEMSLTYPLRQVCAAASDRESVEGRTAGLRCHDAADNSAKDAGSVQ